MNDLASKLTMQHLRLQNGLVLLITGVCAILLIVSLATTSTGKQLSWTAFQTPGPQGTMFYHLGYSHMEQCWVSHSNPANNVCYDLTLITFDEPMGGVCHNGGIGVIVGYSLALLFILLSSIFVVTNKSLTTDSAWIKLSNSRIVTACSVGLFAATAAPIIGWYVSCNTRLSSGSVSYSGTNGSFPIEDVQVGAGLGLSVAICALSVVAIAFCLWRALRARETHVQVVVLGSVKILDVESAISDEHVPQMNEMSPRKSRPQVV